MNTQMRHVIPAVLIASLLAGCSAQQVQKVTEIERLAIVPAEESTEASSADSTGKRAGKGALRGGGTGAAVGALLSLGCGPFVVACMGVAVPALGGAGALGGSLYATTGLPTDQAERVSGMLGELGESRDLNRELLSQIYDTLPSGRLVESDKASALMHVAIERIELDQDSGDRFALVVRASTRLESADTSSPLRARVSNYRSTSVRLGLDDWFANGGEAFHAELSRCLEEIAAQIARDIGARHASVNYA